ncbi:MAG: tetratricopeptide repeat protein [Flavobacteriales bacterium]|nr:tetratricopeptide repeat protein [Flavobacteriales bacterium]
MSKLIALIFISFSFVAFSQKQKENTLEKAQARVFLRAGNKQYEVENYSEAQALYKKALDKNSAYNKASFNLGNAIYKQKNYKDALPQFELNAKTATSKLDKANAYHNIGDLQMEQKQYSKAVQAFKNSLRNNPLDEDTRYNLALAQKLLQKKLDEEKKNKDKKDKNKDNKDEKNKDNKDNKDEKKDQDKKDKDKDGDKDEKKDPNKDKDKSDKDKKPQQPKKGQMSPEKMKQLLEAMNNEEKKTQKKMNAKRVKGQKIKRAKDW